MSGKGAPTKTFEQFIQGHVVRDVVYLNADQVVKILLKLGLGNAAESFDQAAQKIRQQAR